MYLYTFNPLNYITPMAIRGNFTQANYDVLIASQALRTSLGVPSGATFEEVRNFFTTIDDIELLSSVTQADADGALNWITEVDGNFRINFLSTGIVNVDFLSNVTRITGTLQLSNSDIRTIPTTDVDLANLASLGSFSMSQCHHIENVTFSSLQTYGSHGGGSIRSNGGLQTIVFSDTATYASSQRISWGNNRQLHTISIRGFTGRINMNFGDNNLSTLNLNPALNPAGFDITRNNFNDLYWINADATYDVVNMASALNAAALEEQGYNALGCAPNDSVWANALRNDGYGFYLSLWEIEYPDGRTDCVNPSFDDLQPNVFTFATTTNAQQNAVVTSNVAEITGFDDQLQVRVLGGINTLISVNGGAFVDTSTEPLISSGDTIQLKSNAPATLNTSVGVHVAVGLTSAVWTISTAANVGPMVVAPLPDYTVEVEDTFDVDVSGVFTDPEHPNLVFELLNAPPSLKIADDHIVGTLTLNDLGTWNAFLQATDDEGAKGLDAFTIEVDINRDDIKELIQEVEEINEEENETAATLQALQEQVNRLETVVAQNTLALLDIPLDGEDMVYWLTKFTQQENALYQLAPSDYPLFIDKRTISVDPATGRSIAEGRALVNGTPEDGVRITLSNSPRLATGTLMTTTTSDNGFYSFDFTSLPNTTYYVSASHGANFYQVAIAYQGTSS